MNDQNQFSTDLQQLLRQGGFDCTCGKPHRSDLKHVVIECGAIGRLPELLRECGAKKPFLLSGPATFAAAGDRVCVALEKTGFEYSKYVFPASPVLPTEHSVGSAVMHFDHSCDVIVGIGSGVINDIGKLLAKISGKRYLIVATAPSMDGYASGSSSMERDGLKVSLDSTAAWAVIGDLDVLCAAPMKMLQAGLGDMLAKYVSLCEWELAHVIVDEYYCPAVAQLVRCGLKKCADAAPLLMQRDPEAVKAVMEGMVLAGLTMNYAGISRPASGMEHYFSHIWDMRGLAFGTKTDLHGIQCGIATLLSLKVYEHIRSLTPDAEAAKRAVSAFDFADWSSKLRAFIGEGAEAMIAGESKEHKYDPALHAARIERIVKNWPRICSVIDAMPTYGEVLAVMQAAGAPTDAGNLQLTQEQVRITMTMSKDIRDKYIGSRLLWDLGVLDQVANQFEV
ncbi:MAG: sn-glycerol-1-phosphate dehydrogenase [Clostridia bacterium]|nr:sn-glycerol-1-phosphate dehydrogenase [Clostridia bacterium]